MEITGIDKVAVDTIAKSIHEVNKAYCESIGDNSLLPWDLTPQHVQDSVIHTVFFNLMNPDAKPSQQHEVWLEFKKKDGWIYGKEKDSEKKTHPCIVPYECLPQEQKTKDYLFKAVFTTVKQILGV